MQNLIKDANKLICRTETDSQTLKTNLFTKGERCWGKDELLNRVVRKCLPEMTLFFLSTAAPAAYGRSQAELQLLAYTTTTATPDP